MAKLDGRWVIRAFVLAAVLNSSLGEANEIPWRSGSLETAAMSEQVAGAELHRLAADQDGGHVLVQFSESVGAAEKALLAEVGVHLLGYVGGHSFFAALDPTSLDGTRAVELTPISAVIPIASDWKLDPRMIDGLTPDWAVVEGDIATDPVVGIYLLFHPDVSLSDVGGGLVADYGGQVRDLLQSINGLVVEIPLSAAYALAEEDAVQWMEFPLPPMDELNSSNRADTGADQAQAAPYNLDGSGITVLVYDGGTALAGHNDFGGRLTTHDSSGTADHATHVSGTVGGDGSASAGNNRGMAPAVTILSYGFQYDGSGVFLYSNPGDLEADYGAAIGMGADISNNSIGTNTAPNGFDCNITGDYGVTSSLIDAIVAGSLGDPFRIVWSNGNERQTTRCGSTYATTAPPACAKNHIAVGAYNSNDQSMTSFSSWGPSDDGRLKPDLSGPGCQSSADFGVTSTSSSGASSYSVKCGTSMSGPTIAGLGALLLEDFRAQFAGQADPRNSTIKSIFAQTAIDLGNTGPDYQFGYGGVRIVPAIELLRLGQFSEQVVTNGASFSTQFFVEVGAPEFKVTLAWDDPPAIPNVGTALVNDLDLVVMDPSGTQRFPWTLDPNNPSLAAVKTFADHINNIEQVQVDNPETGLWTIQIVGTNVPQGPQTFSLAGAGAANVGIIIGYPNGLPSLMPADTPMDIDVQIGTIAQTVVPGSATLHYRYDGGAFTATTMVSQGGDLYRGTLPAASCGQTPEFYVSVEGSDSGLTNSPADAPTSFFAAEVGDLIVSLTDDFEIDLGWTVVDDVALADGSWEVGVPAGAGDRGDPATDYDGSGKCFLTHNLDGNSDVDGGTTWLISPTVDLSEADADVSYALWYTNNFGAEPNNDLFRVAVSNDDGVNWTEVALFGPITSGGWSKESFKVGDFVTPTPLVKVRFEVSDLGLGSVVEAAIDEFVVSRVVCEVAGPPQIISAQSVVDHGGLPFGLDLSVADIEPRNPGVTELVVAFDQPMDVLTAEDPANVSIIGVNNPSPAVVATPTLDGSGLSLTIALSSALPDGDCYTVDLTGMTAAGLDLDPLAASFTVQALRGDTNVVEVVSTGDSAVIKPHFGEALDASNAAFDFDANGVISTGDASVIKPLFGNATPGCP